MREGKAIMARSGQTVYAYSMALISTSRYQALTSVQALSRIFCVVWVGERVIGVLGLGSGRSAAGGLQQSNPRKHATHVLLTSPTLFTTSLHG